MSSFCSLDRKDQELLNVVLALITLRDVIRWIALSPELEEIKELLRQIGRLPSGKDSDANEAHTL